MYTLPSLVGLTKRQLSLPLVNIKYWSPFQIDALGLVTLLGSDEVNQAIGTLQRRRYTEYLPLLAAFVVAGDRFITEQPGFVIFNLSDGITSTELKGWFTRWLMSQKVNNATTVLTWKSVSDKSRRTSSFGAFVLSSVLLAPLVTCTILMEDWYGVANAAAIIISVVVRIYLLSKLRHARDRNAAPAQDNKVSNAVKKSCIVRSDGKMVTCYAPQSVLKTFFKDSSVSDKRTYHCVRWLGWLALGAHMCVLGMCALFTQIYTVLLLVLSTWVLTTDFNHDVRRKFVTKGGSGFEKSIISIPFSHDWTVEQVNYPTLKKNPDHDPSKETSEPTLDWDRRQVAWARLAPDDKGQDDRETAMLDRWNLLPIEAQNPKWWTDYESLKLSLRETQSADEKNPSTLQAQHHLDRPSTSPRTPSMTHLMPKDSRSSRLSPSMSPTPTLDLSRSSSPGNNFGTSTAPAAPASTM